uniref:NIPSNAP domain-containing protein n=1 Tax=Xiphophorus couchianus TaxID=32473 RepID=A0A3B5MDW9_9TELE
LPFSRFGAVKMLKLFGSLRPSAALFRTAARAAVRAALAQDPSWISEYICKALPLLTAQDNEVSYLVPWSRLKSPPQQGVHALWWFESADHRAECRHKAHTDARVVAAVRNSVAHLDSQRNQLMFPCTFSPMK